MEHIHAADHRWLTHEGKTVDSPWDATDFGVHLDQNLAHDRAQVLAFGDRAHKHDLGGNRELSQQELLDVIVQGALAFLAGKKKHHHLDAFLELGLHRLDPVVCSCRWFDFTHLRLGLVIPTSVEALLHR